MYNFPKDFYSDVRIEKVFQTAIQNTMGKYDEIKEKEYEGALLRLFDGKRWYYSSITEIDSIQEELDKLAQLAHKNKEIEENPIVKNFEVNKGEFFKFQGENSVKGIALRKKKELLDNYAPVIAENKFVKTWRLNYMDKNLVKYFYSSKGADLKFDTQMCGFRVYYKLNNEDKNFEDMFSKASENFEDITNCMEEYKTFVRDSVNFLNDAVDVIPGKYPVVLSPETAGVFAHESFGHKSEADFMIGDKTMMKEWEIGKKVGSDILSIVDDGNLPGSGFVPFDDEGTKANETYLIKNGVLTGRLHSSVTAASLNEDLTGNARAITFEYEPIVRMTSTYIKPGEKTFKEIIKDIDKGVYIESFNHGSGMSTFTIAPRKAFMIRDGAIAEPVKISVISGNVFETLNLIEDVTEEYRLRDMVGGGCGKMEQFPLSVSFGGPFVKIKTMNVQ